MRDILKLLVMLAAAFVLAFFGLLAVIYEVGSRVFLRPCRFMFPAVLFAILVCAQQARAAEAPSPPAVTIPIDLTAAQVYMQALANAGAACDAGIKAYCELVQPIDRTGTLLRDRYLVDLRRAVIDIQKATAEKKLK